MKIPIKQIYQRKEKVDVASGESRIDQIKAELRECVSPQFCKAEVYEMWED